MLSHTTNDDDSRGCIPSKTVPERCKVTRHPLAVESRNPLAMAHTSTRPRCVHANMWDGFSDAHIRKAVENTQPPGIIWGDFIGYKYNILAMGLGQILLTDTTP